MLKHIASAAIAASVLMSSSAVMANDWFVGATVGSADHGYKEHNGLKPEFRDVYTAFRAGTYISENIRVYANLGHVKGSEEDNYEDIKLNSKIKNLELSISEDYVDNLFQFSNTKYFIGGTLGYNQMKIDIS